MKLSAVHFAVLLGVGFLTHSIDAQEESAPVPAPAPAPAPGPGPSSAGTVTSGNTTGSIAYACSTQANLQQLLSNTSDQASTGLNVTIPTNLTDSNSIQNIAQVAWQFIVTYPAPFYVKTVAGATANSTTANRFSSASNHTSVPSDNLVTPNTDTVYTTGWLDLSFGPQIVTVPVFDSPRRYWIVQLSDVYQNFFGSLGFSNNSTGQYLIIGRNAQRNATYGNFTADRIIQAPTDLVSIFARILVFNESDQATATQLGRGFNITAFNGTNSNNATSKSALISKAAFSTGFAGYGPYGNAPGFLDGLSRYNPAGWFNISQTLFLTDPPVNSSDYSGSEAQASIGFSYGNNLTNPSPDTVTLFQTAAQVAKACIVPDNAGLVTSTNWRYNPSAGYYTTQNGTNYLTRAQDIRYIPQALPVSEIIYYQTAVDSTGANLDGRADGNYSITFTLPIPYRYYWSLIIYNATSLNLVNNPLNRYSVSDRTPDLVYGDNNSTLTAYVSSAAPANGTTAYSNWIPAPDNAPFIAILRISGVTGSTATNQYAPPPFVKIPSGSPVATAG